MTGKEIFWLVMVFATMIPFWLVSYRVFNKVNTGRGTCAMAAIQMIGVFIVVIFPTRQLRIVTDTEHLSHPPFKVAYLKEPAMDDPVVDLMITNTKGRIMHLDVYRDTRVVRFSGVRLPDSIQF